MDQEQTFQALKEILPELQAKLRQSIEQQCRVQLANAQLYYEQYAQDLAKKRQIEVRQEIQGNQSQLRKELGRLQRQRQQWLILENNYKQTIFELTEKLRENCGSSSNISALTEIVSPNVQAQTVEIKPQVWKKKKSCNNIVQNNERNLFDSGVYEQNLLEQRPLQVVQPNNQKTAYWKPSNKNLQEHQDFKQRGRRQDTMVLSPPKTQQKYEMKGSVLQPPILPPSTRSSFLRNDQGKKKLLSMIRNIK